MFVIEVKNLSKSYGKLRAVDGVSFSVEEGEIFGLLGPNGAGKTTTLEMLEGFKNADSGTIKILDRDPRTHIQEIRPKIGIVLQQAGFFLDLNILELLNLFSGFYSEPRPAGELLEKFELSEVAQKTYRELSGGQRQRFALSIALISRPKLLFLDEPTIGLDPAIRQKFWEIILGLREEGLSILLTTHYMEEAEIVCDRVGVIDHGRIVAVDRPVRLINSLGVVSRIKFMSSKPINVGELEQVSGILSARQDRYQYDLETESPEASLRELLEWERKFSGRIFNLQVQQATLEDVFLKLTGHSLRE